MRDTFIEWLILINIITFVIYALDKYKAVHHLWRIFLAIIGGSPAAILAMYTIRHKTRHIKFTLGVPVILVIQIIVLYILYTRYGIFTG